MNILDRVNNVAKIMTPAIALTVSSCALLPPPTQEQIDTFKASRIAKRFNQCNQTAKPQQCLYRYNITQKDVELAETYNANAMLNDISEKLNAERSSRNAGRKIAPPPNNAQATQTMDQARQAFRPVSPDDYVCVKDIIGGDSPSYAFSIVSTEGQVHQITIPGLFANGVDSTKRPKTSDPVLHKSAFGVVHDAFYDDREGRCYLNSDVTGSVAYTIQEPWADGSDVRGIINKFDGMIPKIPITFRSPFKFHPK